MADDIESHVRRILPWIMDCVHDPSLATELLSRSIITDADATRIRTMMQNDTYKANDIMMECVFKANVPGKWPSFVDALGKTGFDYLRRLLMSPNDDDDECVAHIFSIIQIHSNDLAEKIDRAACIELVTRLYSKRILSEIDKDNIISEQNNKSTYQANLILLKRMKCKATPREWYYRFLQALVDVGRQDLVETIEPKFLSNKKGFLEKFGMTDMADERQMTSDPEDNQVYEEVVYVREEGAEDTNDLGAPPVPPRTFSLEQSLSDLSDEEKFDSNTNLKQLNIKPEMKSKNVLTCGPRRESLAESSEESNSMASDVEDDDSDDVVTYVLRPYQEELTEDAVRGKNTIICSETGTGKTWVALEIVKKHFQAGATNGIRKVAFMARTSLLVKQQADRFRHYLPMYKTKLITGEDEDSKKLNMYMELNDILCFTPQILVNNLDIKAVKSVSEFSLLILDECHHTRGDEPYNRLMRKYLVEKSEKVPSLPQVIGLTASIGVGKSRTDDEAVDYIIKVMACLDTRILSTVERNIEELKKYTNLPEEETIPLQKPLHDPCKNVLLEAIEETEDLLDEQAFIQPDIVDMITDKKPAEKESQAYNKWTVDIFKSAQLKVDDHDISRDICACARYLNTYNSALEINKLLRCKDVIKYLAQKHEQDGMHKDKHTDMERRLFQKLLDVQRRLRKDGRDTENPNVRILSDTLKKMLEGKGEESRALVFVKARATCRSLAEFLDTDLGKLGYRTSPLYGKENRGGDDGMTESVQTDILEKFRNGFFRVLVCTSVGNEGIDVPQCNIVLSYEYSGDEITKIQMKGRARKKDATVAMMADEKMMEQDRINAYKAAMMYRALKRIKLLEPRYIEMKVQNFQTEEMAKHRFKVATEDYKKSRKSKEDLEILCGRCNKRVTFVSDVRQMGSNFVVIDRSIVDKVNRKEHKKPKKYDGLHKKYKMFCKKCGLDWGIIGICKGLDCHVLKIENLKFRNCRTQEVNVYKKWLDQPYRVPEMSHEDVPKLLGESMQ